MFALLLVTLLPVVFSGWLPVPENCWHDENCLTPYNMEKYPMTVKYDFTTVHSWMYARFWNGKRFVGAISWKYHNSRLTLKSYTNGCGWEELKHIHLEIDPQAAGYNDPELTFSKASDYLSISIYASNAHDKEIYRYSFSEQKCGGQWKKAVYKISFYGLYSVNAQWYRYSVLGFDDEIGELSAPFQPVPEDCYQEFWCTLDYPWGAGGQVQLKYDVTGSEDWLEVDVWRGETDVGGIGWGYNATDGSIYVELYGYDFGCEVDKIGNYPVDYVWGEQILTFYKTAEYLTMFVGEEVLFQHVFGDTQCQGTWDNGFDRISFVFLEWVGASYR